jgi:hypothetical protein
MTRKGGLAAAAVVVVFNALTLWGAWANRSGEPEAALELTEREVSLPPREAENTALALTIEWVDPEAIRTGPGWFDRRKLEELGFDCRLPATAENRFHYQGQAPRRAFAVFEYEGAAWQRYLAEPKLSPPADRWAGPWHAANDPADRQRGSHLVLVDVGLDPAGLRARYPDRRRQVVLPAITAILFRQDGPSQSPHLEGRVTTVLPPQVSVPRAQRLLLETLQTERQPGGARREGGSLPAGEPRFAATVKWGRSLEPWLADVRRIDPRH